MIEKIVSLKNIGRFVDFQLKPGNEWNGSFTKINVIYAVNGSGKTTLSTILKSLKLNDAKLIDVKKTFDQTEEISIRIKESSSGQLIEFQNNVWNRGLSQIEVLDVNYIEDYLYIGSILKKQIKTNLFKLLLGDQGIEFKQRYMPYAAKKQKIFKEKKIIKNKQKWAEIYASQLSELNTKLNDIHEKYLLFSQPILSNYISVINKYLVRFSPYIQLVSLNSTPDVYECETFRLVLSFNIHGGLVHFQGTDFKRKIANAKYVLSEGDKSSIALAFFLAVVEIQGYENRIIVFDDPISSFDYGRKTTTINQLAKVASKCEQFFLLTHDLHFAKEFTDKVAFEPVLNLKIENNGITSLICKHDIESETLSSIQKDIQTIKNYMANGALSDFARRDVIRCIRPILEGAFKTKYFDSFANNEWLGDIISKIRQSNSQNKLHKLKPLLDDVIELNDFTKKYHHSNTTPFADNINPSELKNYVDLLLRILDQI